MIRQEIPSSKDNILGSVLMGITEEMKKIAEEIVFSYQSKISEVAMIIDNTSQLLEDFKTQRNEMSNQLKETLAKEESLRKKDFDNMMQDIVARQDEREKEARDLLMTFFDEQKDIADVIRKNLTGEEKIRIDDFRKRLKDIQAMQKARENEVTTVLRQFLSEYKQMAESLRSLLNKGEAVRIKDFKEMMKNIRTRQPEMAGEPRTFYREAWGLGKKVRGEVSAKEEILKGGEVGEKEMVGKI